MNSVSYIYSPVHAPGATGAESLEKTSVVGATFADHRSAQAAVRELREIGIPAEDISLVGRDADMPATGAELEVKGTGRLERSEPRKPHRPVVTDYEVPPDEPLGGSEGLGLTRDDDDDSGQHDEAYPGDGLGVYVDFPEEPDDLDQEYPPTDREARAVAVPVRGYVEAAGGAAVGAGLGGLVGLLAGMAGLTIPGIGPLLAAGPLAAALSGLITGGATGAIAGALSTVGLPGEYIQQYAAQIEQGRTLVLVRADDLIRDPVERVLVANGGENVYCHET